MLRHQRAVVAGALLLITVLAWAALLQGAGTGMSVAAMTTWRFPPPRVAPEPGAWDIGYWLTMLAMWWVMMVAMMVPSAAPMILLYARVARGAPAEHGDARTALGPSAAFTAGYLACWLGFSVLTVALQFALESFRLLDGMMMWSVNRWLTGGLLIAAGLYQLSPVKQTCLTHCRAPATFLAHHRRPGTGGAFRLGLIHGSHCIGCCWVLMLLLFAAGIMNLVWIVGLAAIVLAEKLFPFGRRLAPVTAGLLATAGLYAILGA